MPKRRSPAFSDEVSTSPRCVDVGSEMRPVRQLVPANDGAEAAGQPRGRRVQPRGVRRELAAPAEARAAPLAHVRARAVNCCMVA